MKYITIVKEMAKTHICHFCHEKPENILEEGKHFIVIPEESKYTKVAQAYKKNFL